jgi:DNA-binding CsgD family transcriptional regulator
VLLLEERRPLGLTPREREILALVAEGHTNAQIAAALWISPATVAKHLENAYAKLGAATRTAAVRLMHEHDVGT